MPVVATAAGVRRCESVGEDVDGHGRVDLQLVILGNVSQIWHERPGDADPIAPVRNPDVVGVAVAGPARPVEPRRVDAGNFPRARTRRALG